MTAPREPERLPVINGMDDEPKPDGGAGQFAVIPTDDLVPPSDDWDAGQFRMFRD
jgi:hypothetical protein